MKKRSNILDRVSDRLQQGHRTDMSVVHAELIDDDTARLIATVGSGAPSHGELQAWITAATNSGLAVLQDGVSFKHTAPKPVVSFFVSLNKQRRTIEECDKDPSLKKVSASAYFDADLGQHWVKEDDTGFLVRSQPDGVQSVIASISTYAGPRTMKTSKTAFANVVYVQDVVEFINPEGKRSSGTVIAVVDGAAKIREKQTGNIYVRPFAAITDVMNTSANRKRRDESEKELWEQMYGHEFANELTK